MEDTNWNVDLNGRDMILGVCAGSIAVGITNIISKAIFQISEMTRNISFISAAIVWIIIIWIIQMKKWKEEEKKENTQ